MKVIACVGYPRSGSTLQFNLLIGILESVRVRFKSLGYMPVEEQYDFVSSVDMTSKDIIVFKAHEIDKRLVGDDGVYIVNSYRDLRDSYLSHKLKWNTDLEQFITQHERFMINYKVFDGYERAICQSYEDKIRDRKEAVRDLIKFFNIECTASIVSEEVSKKNSISHFRNSNEVSPRQRLIILVNNIFIRFPSGLKKLSRRLGISKFIRHYIVPHDVEDKKTLMHPNHISVTEGEPGKWKEMLDQREIDEINARFSDWLSSKGYKA